MRPFIKLGEDNKRVMDRPFQPKLPNEPLLGECLELSESGGEG